MSKKLCVGSYPLIGIVSAGGVLPCLRHGVVNQAPGEFGMSVDLETNGVSVIYNDVGWRRTSSSSDHYYLREGKAEKATKEEQQRKKLDGKKRMSSHSTKKSGSSSNKSNKSSKNNKNNLFLSSASHRKKQGGRSSLVSFLSRLKTRQIQKQQSLLQGWNESSAREEPEYELITNELFHVKFKGASMVEPLRIVVDRVNNKILSFTPKSQSHFEISIPQLRCIKGPLIPSVSFSSGGFREYCSRPHPEFSSILEDFLDDYIQCASVRGNSSTDIKVEAPLEDGDDEEQHNGREQGEGRHCVGQRGDYQMVGEEEEEDTMKESRSPLMLFNRSLLKLEYLRLFPSSSSSSVAAAAALKQDEQASRSKNRGRKSALDGIGWESFPITASPMLDSRSSPILTPGTRTLLKLRKGLPCIQSSGAPRRQRRAPQLQSSVSNPPSPTHAGTVPTHAGTVPTTTTATGGSTLPIPYQDFGMRPSPATTLVTSRIIPIPSSPSYSSVSSTTARRPTTEKKSIGWSTRKSQIGVIKKRQSKLTTVITSRKSVLLSNHSSMAASNRLSLQRPGTAGTCLDYDASSPVATILESPGFDLDDDDVRHRSSGLGVLANERKRMVSKKLNRKRKRSLLRSRKVDDDWEEWKLPTGRRNRPKPKRRSS